MKKQLATLLCTLCILALSANTRPRVITVTGQFLYDKNVVVTLYQVDSLGNYNELESSQSKREYYIRLYTKTKYVLKFESKHKTKYMEVEIKIHKNIEVDIDFRQDNSIHLEYDDNGLSIKNLNNQIAIK
jgi:hypothetical protein